MRPQLALGAALSLAAAFSWGAATAASLADNPPKTATVCIDVGGRSLPAVCHAQASRLDAREDICICPSGAQQVTASVCPAGVKAPAESAAYERARRAAIDHGSLVGANFNGKPMCVAPRNALNE